MMIIPNIHIQHLDGLLSEAETLLNQMWAKRDRLDIQGQNAADLRRQIERMEYMVRITKDLLKATNTITLQAAE